MKSNFIVLPAPLCEQVIITSARDLTIGLLLHAKYYHEDDVSSRWAFTPSWPSLVIVNYIHAPALDIKASLIYS